MKKIYVILDAMSTGNIPDVRSYLENFVDPDYSLTLSDHYFEHEAHSLNDYHLKYMLIDLNFIIRFGSKKLTKYHKELIQRVIEANDLGFRIVLYNLWEDSENHMKTDIADLLKKCGVKKFYILSAGKGYFWFYMHRLYQNWHPLIDHSNKKFDFLYLNKNPRSERKYLFYSLKKTNILDNSLYTWWENFPKQDNSKRIRLPEEYEVPAYKKDYPVMGLDQTIHLLPYEHSKINIVTETFCERKLPIRGFITEKLWKPIICLQPFVVLGYQHYLKDLKDMGFKTFDSVWNEDYDNASNPYKRADDIIKLMSKIKDMNSNELYKQTEQIRVHNRNLFFNYPNMRDRITKDIRLAFEIY